MLTVAIWELGTAINHRVPEWVKTSFVIFDIWSLWHTGVWSIIAVPIWQQWASKG